MRYVIIGAGAIGGTIGGLLADAGHEVLFVARGEHGRIIQANGLTLGVIDREVSVKVSVVSSIAELELRADDVLVLAVKSQDSAAILSELAGLPVGDADAGELLPVFCFQNGVASEYLASRSFANVHGVCVTLPATYLEAGRVEGNGSPMSGIFELGLFPSGSDEIDEAVARDLIDSGFLATVRDDVMAWKRMKLLANLNNAVEVVCGREADPDRAEVGARLRAEGLAVIQAAGLSLLDNEEWTSRVSQLTAVAIGGRPRQGGSTWQSLARGLGSVETEYLNGEIVSLGLLHGVPTPVNSSLQRRMRAVVRLGRMPEPIPAAQLLA